jgi:GxxExxY protein
MEVHRGLGPGFYESVYQHALAHELATRGLAFETERRVSVKYKTWIVGEFDIDLLVEDKIIVELKAVAQLNQAHQAQAINYLAATGLELALLINFGEPSLRFKRVIRQPSNSFA